MTSPLVNRAGVASLSARGWGSWFQGRAIKAPLAEGVQWLLPLHPQKGPQQWPRPCGSSVYSAQPAWRRPTYSVSYEPKAMEQRVRRGLSGHSSEVSQAWPQGPRTFLISFSPHDVPRREFR